MLKTVSNFDYSIFEFRIYFYLEKTAILPTASLDNIFNLQPFGYSRIIDAQCVGHANGQ
jgi:hypothetical protein